MVYPPHTHNCQRFKKLAAGRRYATRLALRERKPPIHPNAGSPICRDISISAQSAARRGSGDFAQIGREFPDAWRRPAIAIRTPRPRPLPTVRRIRASRSPRLLDLRPRETPYTLGVSGGFRASSPMHMGGWLTTRLLIGGGRCETTSAPDDGVCDLPLGLLRRRCISCEDSHGAVIAKLHT